MSTHPADLSATEAAVRIAAGSLRPEALLEACLDRIAQRDPTVRAFAHLDPALARAAPPRQGPLAGLPVGVKDVLDTADQPTQYGSPIWAGHRPRADAAAVAITRRAGGVILGKTVTTEFATRHPGPTSNPHDARRTPGGSSSGSAAGVAAGFFPLAFGTQTAGSVLRPAAYCGVTGFKPSFGLIHRAGMKVMSESLDTIGVFGRGVADCALFTAALTGLPLTGPAPGAAPRIALCAGPGGDTLPAETLALLDRVATACGRAGARITRLDLPAPLLAAHAAHPVVMNGESTQALAWERLAHPDALSPVLAEKMDWGAALPAGELAAARASFATARAAFRDLMADYDVVLTPAAPGEAPRAWAGPATRSATRCGRRCTAPASACRPAAARRGCHWASSWWRRSGGTAGCSLPPPGWRACWPGGEKGRGSELPRTPLLFSTLLSVSKVVSLRHDGGRLNFSASPKIDQKKDGARGILSPALLL